MAKPLQPTNARWILSLVGASVAACAFLLTACAQPTQIRGGIPTPTNVSVESPVSSTPVPLTSPSIAQTAQPASVAPTEPAAPTPTDTGPAPTFLPSLTPSGVGPTPSPVRPTPALNAPPTQATTQVPVSPSPGAPGALSKIPLGLRVDNSAILPFWNQYVGPQDITWGGVANAAIIANVRAGTKALTYSDVTQTQHVLDVAKAQGIHTVIFNLEGVGCQPLTTNQAQAYAIARQQATTFVFAPTGLMLRRCLQQYPQMLQNADAIIFQTEALQDKDPNYVGTVKSVIHTIKAMRPGLPVWVQVSVNPPAKQNITPEEVIATIKGIEDGSADSPDRINVFYRGEAALPGKVEVMQQVIQTLRTATN